ncbi:MAG: CehA/McbA family metallohydrolase [Acidobacteriota bacterium]
MPFPPDVTRRGFLGSIGAGPALGLLSVSSSAHDAGRLDLAAVDGRKFHLVDLGANYSASSLDFDLLNRPAGLASEGLLTPVGPVRLRGIPFQFGERRPGRRDWLAISRADRPGVQHQVEIPVGRQGAFVCFAHFCDWPAERGDSPDPDRFESVGEVLTTVALIYEDGLKETFAIRRRFEINTPSIPWGHFAFAAAPGSGAVPKPLDAPLARGTDWGGLQMGFDDSVYRPPILWLCPLKNPRFDKVITGIKLTAESQSTVVICGLTLCLLAQHPLRYQRLSTYRLTLPDESAEDLDRWTLDIDLGVIARQYVLPAHDPASWMESKWAGLGESKGKRAGHTGFRYLEIAASEAASLAVTDRTTGAVRTFDLSGLDPGTSSVAKDGGRLEVLDRQKVWVRGRILDEKGRPTPARLAFRSGQGRYFPPYGHRAEINTGWFQDYGADLKVGVSSFAYVDGSFEAELPVGEVCVEISKGFEYRPVRQRLQIRPDARSLDLSLERWVDLRSKGWVTADTHVHFLSPSTALLESRAEGVNLVNLLAAQLGNLFTNVGDLPGGALVSRDGEHLVRLGTENRQHLLGHISLLNGTGEPVFPLSSGGPSTSYFGDPVRFSLAEWADACRQREGLVIAPHFPNPPGEIAADIVTGRIDGVELWPLGAGFGFPFQEWYRYLNCGYRLPAVGGTDKMSAGTPVGANRTYAYLGDREFTFEQWVRAVRSGNTFCSSGPVLFLEVEGKPPGSEISLGSEGGTVAFKVEARSNYPLHRVELLCNGRVAASTEDGAGKLTLGLSDCLKIRGPGWLAARCLSIVPGSVAWPFTLAAHTSPVYLTVPGKELYSAPVAGYLLKLVEGAEAWVTGRHIPKERGPSLK